VTNIIHKETRNNRSCGDNDSNIPSKMNSSFICTFISSQNNADTILLAVGSIDGSVTIMTIRQQQSDGSRIVTSDIICSKKSSSTNSCISYDDTLLINVKMNNEVFFLNSSFIQNLIIIIHVMSTSEQTILKAFL
jgi:hypothetical protein